jgi:heme oxygenase
MAAAPSGAAAADAPPLSRRLVAASRRAHSVSDALVNARLVGLVADARTYARALACFAAVHAALEAALERAAGADARLARFRAAARPLYRAAAFERDLAHHLGAAAWRADAAAAAALPAVEAYVGHLQRLADERPLLVAAHALTQLLAVAAGGGAVARVARRGLGLAAGGPGTAAFEFAGGVAAARAGREALKAAFDALEPALRPGEAAALEAEHVRAFELNNAIVRDYKVGATAPLRGALRLALGPRAAALAAALAVAALATYAARRWM